VKTRNWVVGGFQKVGFRPQGGVGRKWTPRQEWKERKDPEALRFGRTGGGVKGEGIIWGPRANPRKMCVRGPSRSLRKKGKLLSKKDKKSVKKQQEEERETKGDFVTVGRKKEGSE